jgi:hypothetical protein
VDHATWHRDEKSKFDGIAVFDSNAVSSGDLVQLRAGLAVTGLGGPSVFYTGPRRFDRATVTVTLLAISLS